MYLEQSMERITIEFLLCFRERRGRERVGRIIVDGCPCIDMVELK